MLEFQSSDNHVRTFYFTFYFMPHLLKLVIKQSQKSVRTAEKTKKYRAILWHFIVHVLHCNDKANILFERLVMFGA